MWTSVCAEMANESFSILSHFVILNDGKKTSCVPSSHLYLSPFSSFIFISFSEQTPHVSVPKDELVLLRIQWNLNSTNQLVCEEMVVNSLRKCHQSSNAALPNKMPGVLLICLVSNSSNQTLLCILIVLLHLSTTADSSKIREGCWVDAQKWTACVFRC